MAGAFALVNLTIVPQSVPPLADPPAGKAKDATQLLLSKPWWLMFASLLAQAIPALNAATTALQSLYPLVIVDLTLAANYTFTALISPVPVAPGQQLAVFLRQNATGGYVTTFDSPPFRGAPSGLATLASTWSLIMFLAQVDPATGNLAWWFQSVVTNQT